LSLTNSPILSVVIPLYQAAPYIHLLVAELRANLTLLAISYEIIMVDDGSSDATWSLLGTHIAKYPNLHGIKLSRNFGQHQAISCGLAHSKGQWIAVMDGDLQDDPKHLAELLATAKKGYDIVFTYKTSRKHALWRNVVSKVYTSLLRQLNPQQAVYQSNMGNYSLISRKVLNAFLQLHDAERQYLMLLHWLGFSHTYICIPHKARIMGKSSYTFHKLIKLAMVGITAHSRSLLYLALYTGILFIVVSFIGIGVSYGANGTSMAYIAALIVFCTGCILSAVGIAGIYIGKIFTQSQGRPLYIVDEHMNFSTNKKGMQ